MLVAVMLNMFYEKMLRTLKRPFVGAEPQLRAIDSYLLVDEPDNIMRYEFQPHVVAELRQFARPEMRAGAGFHADKARRQTAEELEDLASSQLAAQCDRPVNLDAMQLQHVLGEIDADGGNLSHGWLLGSGTFRRPHCGASRRREQEPSTSINGGQMGESPVFPAKAPELITLFSAQILARYRANQDRRHDRRPESILRSYGRMV